MKLKELVEICYGKNQRDVETDFSDIPILGTGGIIGYAAKALYNEESVLIGRKGTIGMPFYINKPFWTIDTLFYTKINQRLIIPKYLYYLLCTIGLTRYSEGAAVPSLTTKTLYEIELEVPNKETQQHIVNTIGSVDDLIENINKQNEKLLHIGLTLINGLNDSLQHQKLSSICELVKGFEIGSQKYIETPIDKSLIHYLRVGDLLSLGSTFVKPSDELMLCSDDDVLIAFDGAPGRNAIGLDGAYSSGIYKVRCKPKYKGLIYFEINSELNQKIIKDHSQGTTILHASKAIPFLETAKVDDKKTEKLNVLFERIINNKKKLKLLNNEKRLLLSKYF